MDECGIYDLNNYRVAKYSTWSTLYEKPCESMIKISQRNFMEARERERKRNDFYTLYAQREN